MRSAASFAACGRTARGDMSGSNDKLNPLRCVNCIQVLPICGACASSGDQCITLSQACTRCATTTCLPSASASAILASESAGQSASSTRPSISPSPTSRSSAVDSVGAQPSIVSCADVPSDQSDAWTAPSAYQARCRPARPACRRAHRARQPSLASRHWPRSSARSVWPSWSPSSSSPTRSVQHSQSVAAMIPMSRSTWPEPLLVLLHCPSCPVCRSALGQAAVAAGGLLKSSLRPVRNRVRATQHRHCASRLRSLLARARSATDGLRIGPLLRGQQLARWLPAARLRSSAWLLVPLESRPRRQRGRLQPPRPPLPERLQPGPSNPHRPRLALPAREPALPVRWVLTMAVDRDLIHNAAGTVGSAGAQTVPTAVGASDAASNSSGGLPIAATAVIAIVCGLIGLFGAYKLYRWHALRKHRKEQALLVPEGPTSPPLRPQVRRSF